MTTTPDTQEPTEQEQAVLERIDEVLSDECVDNDAAIRLFEDLGPLLAAIRRQAAADALKAAAARLGAVNSQYVKQLKHYDFGSDAYKLTYARAGQATADARKLRQAAQDVIAEGYEHTCGASWAATRTDPGYGCDAPVENEGDYCARHEPEDDEDPRWDE